MTTGFRKAYGTIGIRFEKCFTQMVADGLTQIDAEEISENQRFEIGGNLRENISRRSSQIGYRG